MLRKKTRTEEWLNLLAGHWSLACTDLYLYESFKDLRTAASPPGDQHKPCSQRRCRKMKLVVSKEKLLNGLKIFDSANKAQIANQ